MYLFNCYNATQIKSFTGKICRPYLPGKSLYDWCQGYKTFSSRHADPENISLPYLRPEAGVVFSKLLMIIFQSIIRRLNLKNLTVNVLMTSQTSKTLQVVLCTPTQEPIHRRCSSTVVNSSLLENIRLC